jgi:hypothetical protein
LADISEAEVKGGCEVVSVFQLKSVENFAQSGVQSGRRYKVIPKRFIFP